MFDLLHVAKAWEMLHNPEITSYLDTDAYFELCQSAGYSKEAAEKAAAAWAFQRLRKNMKI